MKKSCFVLCALSFVFCQLLAAQEKIDDRIKLESDILYGKGGDQDLHLDLAMPKEGKGPFPAVVCIHGGGWKGGDYKQFKDTLKQFANRGYVAISVQYRLTKDKDPKNRFPAQVEDVKCSVRWLRGSAEKYKVDVNRIGATGFSAGGHLSLMLAVTAKEDSLEGAGDLNPEFAKQSSAVQAVVDFFGPTDLTLGDWKPDVEPLLLDFLGGSLKDKHEAYAKASPITYVRQGRKLPPFLCFHGTNDDIVRHHQSVKFVEAVKALGGQAELISMEGEGHGWRGEKMAETVVKTMAFFDQQLKGRN